MEIDKIKWNDWKWQQSNAISSLEGLRKTLPRIPDKIINQLTKHQESFRIRLTPYLLSLVNSDNNLFEDPVLNQFLPFSNSQNSSKTSLNENWEFSDDTVTPILQHKHKNRAAFRIQNVCLSYCMYCFEAKRVLEKHSSKQSYTAKVFNDSISYLKEHPEIEEVILSGGEPLILGNQKLKEIISTISNIDHVQSIRLHTRALTHNPFRIDEELIEILDNSKINCINIHIAHPVEITKEFIDASRKLQSARLLLLAHTPLLKGINDHDEVLKNLFMNLFKIGIKPYYLLHSMPETLLSSKYRTSVKKGVELIKKLKRYYSNPAIPEYIIVHERGKQTVPLELNSTNEFRYKGNTIEFKNWEGKWCIYPDETK